MLEHVSTPNRTSRWVLDMVLKRYSGTTGAAQCDDRRYALPPQESHEERRGGAKGEALAPDGAGILPAASRGGQPVRGGRRSLLGGRGPALRGKPGEVRSKVFGFAEV